MIDTETVRWAVPMAVLVTSSTVAAVARMVHRRRPKRRAMPGMETGVVLFTSLRCPGCDPARSRLVEVLGPEGFREVKWTESPQIFTNHRIDRVPTAAAVQPNGVALLWEGMPPTRLLQKWKSLVNQR